jgi:hypothetical protein
LLSSESIGKSDAAAKKVSSASAGPELTKWIDYNMLLLDFMSGRGYDFKKNGSSFF